MTQAHLRGADGKYLVPGGVPHPITRGGSRSESLSLPRGSGPTCLTKANHPLHLRRLTWLAQRGAHGLVRASFVPPQPIRELRDLTRTRTAITRERSREVQRLEKLLEDAGIKLSSVATDIVGVSERAMLQAQPMANATPLCWPI